MATEASDSFERLLSRYIALRTSGSDRKPLRLDVVRSLLDGFRSRRRTAEEVGEREARDTHRRLLRLMDGHAAAVERDRKAQETVAEDFNLLGVLQLTKNEVRHSMVLAWLLDHDLHRLGTHAQGNLGFRLFLHQAELPAEYAECPYWVRREVRGNASIVDVEVASRNNFVIHIENKIWSAEGPDQTHREWEDLQRRARELSVPAGSIHAMFLTPKGVRPLCNEFRCLSWNSIEAVLEKFASAARPDDVRLFARHYARTLKRFVSMQDTDKWGNDEIAVQ